MCLVLSTFFVFTSFYDSVFFFLVSVTWCIIEKLLSVSNQSTQTWKKNSIVRNSPMEFQFFFLSFSSILFWTTKKKIEGRKRKLLELRLYHLSFLINLRTYLMPNIEFFFLLMCCIFVCLCLSSEASLRVQQYDKLYIYVACLLAHIVIFIHFIYKRKEEDDEDEQEKKDDGTNLRIGRSHWIFSNRAM